MRSAPQGFGPSSLFYLFLFFLHLSFSSFSSFSFFFSSSSSSSFSSCTGATGSAQQAAPSYREREDHVVLLRTKGGPVEQLVEKHIARSAPVQVHGQWYDVQVLEGALRR